MRANRTNQTPVTESEIKKQILEYLTVTNIFAWRQNCGAFIQEENGTKRFIRCGIPGCSDIIGCLPDGRFLAVECKRPGGKLTMAQKAFLAEIAKNGGVAIVASSVEDVERILKTKLNNRR